MFKSILAVLGTAILVGACASVTRGTTEPVTFDSDPPGAEMRSIVDYPCGGPCPVRSERIGEGAPYNDDARTEPVPGPACVTPCTVNVKRNEDLVVTFSKAGYTPQTVKLGRHITGGGAAGVAGNVIAGGAVGLAVDAVTSAGMDHHPNPLKVTLVPLARR